MQAAHCPSASQGHRTGTPRQRYPAVATGAPQFRGDIFQLTVGYPRAPTGKVSGLSPSLRAQRAPEFPDSPAILSRVSVDPPCAGAEPLLVHALGASTLTTAFVTPAHRTLPLGTAMLIPKASARPAPATAISRRARCRAHVCARSLRATPRRVPSVAVRAHASAAHLGAHFEAFVALGGNLVALGHVVLHAAHVGHEHARLARNVGTHVPAVGQRIERRVGNLVVVLHPSHLSHP